MLLHDRQIAFTKNVGLLIAFIYSKNYSATFGDAFRSAEQAALNAASGKGIANSLHCKRLAIDLNLFDAAGSYVTDKASYEPFGIYWKTLSPLNKWGGDFVHLVDSNHFEMTDK